MLGNLNIAVQFKAAVSWLFLCFTAFPFLAFSQLSISMQSQVKCQGTDVFVPVSVSDFNDVGAFTLFITCDTNTVKFIAVENIHTLLSNGSVVSSFDANPVPGINISWFRITPVNIADGKLFDLHLTLLDSTSFLVFDSSCEVGLSDLSVVENVIYRNGYIAYLNHLNEQPASLKVGEQTDAVFTVTLFQGVAYQWQVNENGTWADINNTLPYSGATSHEILVRSVPSLMNNFRYRCRLTLDDCVYYSGEATLQVSGLSVPAYGEKGIQAISLFPNPVHGTMHVTAKIPLDQVMFQLVDLAGRILLQSGPVDMGKDTVIDFDLESFVPGMCVLQVLDSRHRVVAIQKVDIQ